MVNSLAGGGTLLTFPALLSVQVPSVAANATSTVALVPGSFSAAWGFRKDLPSSRRLLWAVLLPSLVGGFGGAYIVAHVSDALFSKLVPWLILGATALFMAQEPLRRWTGVRGVGAGSASEAKLAAVQLVISLYGGFFGAGMGIMMLAALALLGFRDIHQMNGLKNLSAVATNGVASVTFLLTHKVVWSFALLMAVGAAVGGYAGARLGRRVGPVWVRRFVSGVGLVIGLYFLVR